jgi:hypothetical protein
MGVGLEFPDPKGATVNCPKASTEMARASRAKVFFITTSPVNII